MNAGLVGIPWDSGGTQTHHCGTSTIFNIEANTNRRFCNISTISERDYFLQLPLHLSCITSVYTYAILNLY